jgi:hypothetical protein
VPTLTPSSRVIFGQDRPEARSRAILEASTATRGLPRRLPLARAFRKPARTRSAMRERSSSATAPSTVNTIRPAGVAVSSDSDRLTNSIPRTWKVERAQEMANAPCEAVKLPDGYHVKTSLVRVGHEPVQFGPSVLRAGGTYPTFPAISLFKV